MTTTIKGSAESRTSSSLRSDSIIQELQACLEKRLPDELIRVIYEYVCTPPQDVLFDIPAAAFHYDSNWHIRYEMAYRREKNNDKKYLKRLLPQEKDQEKDDKRLRVHGRVQCGGTYVVKEFVFRCLSMIRKPREKHRYYISTETVSHMIWECNNDYYCQDEYCACRPGTSDYSLNYTSYYAGYDLQNALLQLAIA